MLLVKHGFQQSSTLALIQFGALLQPKSIYLTQILSLYPILVITNDH